MKYSKITGMFLKFHSGERLQTGISYSSQEIRSSEHQIVIRTFDHGKIIETTMDLSGPKCLDFKSKSDDPRIPMIVGHFLNTDYEECVLNAVLADQNINISGVVTKLDSNHALSTKTLTEIATGKIVGIMQEQVELISEEEFKKALSSK